MTAISLCDVMVRRRSSLPFSVVDPAASLYQVELAEADPGMTGSTARYARTIRTFGTARSAVVPAPSLHQVDLAAADPDTHSSNRKGTAREVTR